MAWFSEWLRKRKAAEKRTPEVGRKPVKPRILKATNPRSKAWEEIRAMAESQGLWKNIVREEFHGQRRVQVAPSEIEYLPDKRAFFARYQDGTALMVSRDVTGRVKRIMIEPEKKGKKPVIIKEGEGRLGWLKERMEEEKKKKARE